MTENNKELEKTVKEQSKQIKKLVAAAIQSDKRMMLLNKKVARQAHTTRNHTNQINSLLQMLQKGR